MLGLGKVVRWTTRISVTLLIVASLALNGALLISAGLSSLLSGLLDEIGFKTPYSSLQTKNKTLDSRNRALVRQQANTRNTVSRHARVRKSALAKKAIRKSGAVAAKGAAVTLPLVANGVLLLSAAAEANEISELCAEASELNNLLYEIGADPEPNQANAICGISAPILPDLPDWVPDIPDVIERAFD